MTTLKDALYNLHPDSGSSPEYARGVLVGAVAAVMESAGLEFPAAAAEVAEFLPARLMPGAFPASWEDLFRALQERPRACAAPKG